MIVLCIGDVVGNIGLKFLQKHLSKLRAEYRADLVITNGENQSNGRGLDMAGADSMFMAGVDIITGGNHIFQRSEIFGMLDDNPSLLRPANYPSANPGKGYALLNVGSRRVLVLNLLGSVFIESPESPFPCADRVLKHLEGQYDIAVVDIHAEATSEKIALGKYLDGRASVVFGTHTHVQTADEKILPGGTGYITDLGMTGPIDSILGVKNSIIIKHFLDYLPARFDIADGQCSLEGAVFEIDDASGRCVRVERVRI